MKSFLALLLLGLPQDPPAPKPVELAYRVVRRPGSDEVPLEARLTTGTPTRLRVKGKTDLPDRTILRLQLNGVREVRKGNLLVEEAGTTITGGFVRVSDGNFEHTLTAVELPRLRLVVTLEPDDQAADLLARLEERRGPRRWELDLVLPGVSGTFDLGTELARLGELQQRTRTLIVEADRLLDLPDRKTAQAEFLQRLKVVHMQGTRADLRLRFPLGSQMIDTYLNSLGGNLPYLERRNGVLWFPGPAPTTPQGAPFSFDALRQEFLDAEKLAAREFVLWVLKDAALDGRTPAHDELLKKHADFPGMRELIGATEEKVRTLGP